MNSRSGRFLLAAVAIVVLVLFAFPLDASEQEQSNGTDRDSGSAHVALVNLEAFLFFSETGRVGDENVAYPTHTQARPESLVNAVVGENASGAPTTSTFVVVSMTGTAQEITARKLRLSLTARAGGKTLLSLVVAGNPLLGKTGETIRKVPFLVHGTGCLPLELVAEVGQKGKRPLRRLERVVPFKCFE